MGRASRSKAERRRVKEAEAKAAAQQASTSTARASRRNLAAFFTAAGPPSDFPYPVGFGALLLALLVAVGYYPALMGGFVWDDVIFSTADPVREWSGIWNIWSNPKSLTLEGHYWPVVYTSFWLEHKLWGLEPAGYHAVNILLQLANTLLVWRLMWRLAVPGAWLIAAVFAVHPLHVESVAWVIERKDLLSGLFYMTAVLVWLRFTEEPRWPRYCGVLGLFVASLFSKTVTVTLPAALLVLAWWKRGRVTVADGLRVLPLFAVGFAIAFADTAYYASREPLDLDYSFVERMQIAAHALWFYVGKILWPVDLAVIYPLWEVGVGDLAAWAYVAAAVALAAGLWFARGRIGRGPLAGALFFLVTLSPVLGFVDYGFMQFSYVADRFQYLAGIGMMAVLIGAGVHAAGQLSTTARKGVLGVVLLGVAVLAGLSWKQSHIYRDEITFFSHIVALNPEGRDAYHNLGKALQDAGRMEEALEAARIAVKQRPEFGNAYGNLGLALQHYGKLDEAKQVLLRGREAQPDNKMVLQNLGEVARRQEQYEEALQWYEAAIKTDRGYLNAYLGKGDALFHLGRYDEAIVHLKKGLSLKPDRPKMEALVHTLIGKAAQKLDRLVEARKSFEIALKIDPALIQPNLALLEFLAEQQSPEAMESMASHLQWIREKLVDNPDGLQSVAEYFRKTQKQYEQALEWYGAVFEADPDYVQAYAGKGESLFQLERYEEAISTFARAIALDPEMSTVPTLRLRIGESAEALGRLEEAAGQYTRVLSDDPDHVRALDLLAKLRYEQEHFKEAAELYSRHIDLDPDNAHVHVNHSIALYRLGRLDEAREGLEYALSLDPTVYLAQTVLELIREESQ